MTTDRIVPLTVFAALPVADFAAPVDWYTRLVGHAPDREPSPGIASYFLAADRDPQKGTLQIMLDTQRAGGGMAVINVAEIASIIGSLQADGFEFTTQKFDIDADAGIHTIVGELLDPDGNLLHIVQPPSA